MSRTCERSFKKLGNKGRVTVTIEVKILALDWLGLALDWLGLTGFGNLENSF